jgi:hypothetical protein
MEWIVATTHTTVTSNLPTAATSVDGGGGGGAPSPGAGGDVNGPNDGYVASTAFKLAPALGITLAGGLVGLLIV